MLDRLLAPVQTKEKKILLRAIEHLGPTVTPHAVALETGVPVLTAVRQLNEVAAETGAHLEVNANGAISYRFAPTFGSAYAFNIGKQLFHANGLFLINLIKVIVRLAVGLAIAITRIVLGLLWFLFRVSFGLILIASIAISIAALVAAIFGGDGGGDVGIDLGGGDAGGGFDCNLDFGSAFSDFFRCFDFTYWDWSNSGYHSHYYCDSYYSSSYSSSYPTSSSNTPALTSSTTYGASDWEGTRKQQSDFLTDVFSFIFGDGSPNADLEQRTWKYIGSVIQRNHGAVIAEQLAPYVGKTTENEDWMLPVLVHFNGVPEVTESGTIVYLFPSLVDTPQPLQSGLKNSHQDTDQLRSLYRSHLTRQAGRAHNVSVPKCLEEREWRFSLAPTFSVWLIAGLICINLAGSWWFFNAVTIHAGTFLFLGPAVHWVATFMLAFASFVMVVPILRGIALTVLNWKIEKRNANRQRLATEIARPDEYTDAKLMEASCLSQMLLGAKTDVVYTTDRDALEQEFEALTPMENISPGYKTNVPT